MNSALLLLQHLPALDRVWPAQLTPVPRLSDAMNGVVGIKIISNEIAFLNNQADVCRIRRAQLSVSLHATAQTDTVITSLSVMLQHCQTFKQ